MKNQTLFSPKDKSKKCLLLQFLFSTLRVKVHNEIYTKDNEG